MFCCLYSFYVRVLISLAMYLLCYCIDVRSSHLHKDYMLTYLLAYSYNLGSCDLGGMVGHSVKDSRLVGHGFKSHRVSLRSNRGRYLHHVPLSPCWYRLNGGEKTCTRRDALVPYAWSRGISRCLAVGYWHGNQRHPVVMAQQRLYVYLFYVF